MNGHVVAEGARHSVPTPVSAAVVKLIHETEAGQRRPSPQNLALALRRASG